MCYAWLCCFKMTNTHTHIQNLLLRLSLFYFLHAFLRYKFDDGLNEFFLDFKWTFVLNLDEFSRDVFEIQEREGWTTRKHGAIKNCCSLINETNPNIDAHVAWIPLQTQVFVCQNINSFSFFFHRVELTEGNAFSGWQHRTNTGASCRDSFQTLKVTGS